jgi:hypothetical protein
MNTPRTWKLLPSTLLILTVGCSGLLGFDDVGFDGAGSDASAGGTTGVDSGVADGASEAGATGGVGGGDAGEADTGGHAGVAGFAGGGGAAGASAAGGVGGVGGMDAGITDGGGGADTGATGGTGGTTNPTDPPPLDLGDVTWLHSNVSGWPVTVTMSSVTFEGSQICLNHDIASKGWPTEVVNGAEVVGNAWVFIYQDDRWYGATWEWLRAPGQTCKNQSSVAGDHIKEAPFDAASGWHPASGQTLYFMVSGFARLGLTNVQERSDPVKVIWP